jgi:toxin ParE1/3/4
MMLKLRLSPKAETDLDDIWLCTLDSWGRVQAEEYLFALDRTIELLRENPMIGLSLEDIRPGYRRMPAASRIIVYRTQDGNLDIIRFLHKSMDVEAQL